MRLFALVNGLVDRHDRPMLFGLPFDMSYSLAVAPNEPGLEYTLPVNRLQYTLPGGLLGYTLPTNRMHYQIPGEQ